MARSPDIFDMSAVTAFVIGGATNLAIGVGFLLYLSFLSILYFAFGLACWWVAWGVWRSGSQVQPIGILLSLVSLLPPTGPLPNLAVWVLLFAEDTVAHIISAAAGTVSIVYFLARRPQFGIGVHGTTGHW